MDTQISRNDDYHSQSDMVDRRNGECFQPDSPRTETCDEEGKMHK